MIFVSYMGSKNPVRNRLKIQFDEPDFYKLIFQKSSSDQQGKNCPTCPKINFTLQSTTYIVYMSKNYYTYNVSDMHTMYIMQAKSEDNKVIDKSNMNPRAGTKTCQYWDQKSC